MWPKWQFSVNVVLRNCLGVSPVYNSNFGKVKIFPKITINPLFYKYIEYQNRRATTGRNALWHHIGHRWRYYIMCWLNTNPGKDGCWGCLGTAKTVLQKPVVLIICAVILAMVNPRMVGFISLCIHFRWYFLLTSRISAPIEQNVVPNCAGTSNSMGRSLNLQQNTACW